MERLTRRQLIVRGGAVAGVAAAGSLAVAQEANRSGPRVSPPPQGAARPMKGLALGGFGALRSNHDPHDYLEWGNREYVRASHTDVVRMQVSWRFLQPQAPGGLRESWDQLDREHGHGALRRLDRQIAAANRDGVRVILGLYHSYPEWSNGTTPAVSEPVTDKPADAKLPLDLSPKGPWSWFVSYLCDRYGGPSRPHIWGLEICNEPNLLCWPQAGVADAVVAMATTAARAVAGRPYPALLLLPGTSDFPDEDVVEQGVMVATGWPGFTSAVLDGLRALDTGGAALPAWSHHNYRDTKVADGRGDRARQVIGLLAKHSWPGDRRLYLTEGGVDLSRLGPSHCPELDLPAADDGPAARELCQARLIQQSFAAMSTPDVALWTQYKVNDQRSDVTTASGLRRDFEFAADGTPVGPGPARPAWHVWRRL
jgi:hypothetical protein